MLLRDLGTSLKGRICSGYLQPLCFIAILVVAPMGSQLTGQMVGPAWVRSLRSRGSGLRAGSRSGLGLSCLGFALLSSWEFAKNQDGP